MNNMPNQLVRHVVNIAVSAIMLYPLIWMLSSSFKLPEHIFTDKGLWPEHFTLNNYIAGWKGLGSQTFGLFFSNSLIVSGLSIAGNVVSCSLAAYAFARLEFRFKTPLFALMLMTMMLPHHVTIIPQYVIFNKLDWINTFLPLVVPKFTAAEGFFVFLMVQFIRNIPRELDKAAIVDGCGPIQIYWRLILPLALPALVTTAIFTFIWTWNDFFSQIIYLSKTQKFTVSLGLRVFLDSSGESSFGSLFAMSVLSLVPVFTIFVFFQRFLIEGLTSGGVKG
ncbi:carbohydrate ABC transporter permease [Paenibacillus doosanensis]|uniref:Trehalose transport system permease protein SugB n=1 Tax=Paenibacillus konkukensis TaxID=2020716 RepID=A0ABY4RIY7_9BACL|nr:MULTISPECIES: carbohydrate ABC transporter permease [Paenibacillus]MCS7461676.1 carbohydrate ABC transporter permease [Paenibacillus doosanensis]UQZ82103.1 Trehalose transport system permease protein SugB [Paenibacillus konkukensis]